MAQVLKDSVRKDILDSAKKEFLLKGINNASMRDIAKGASVTVGNLYRYFESKEDIARTIIHRPLFIINNTIEQLTNKQLSFFKETETLNKTNEDIMNILDNIIDVLAEVYASYPDEMTILMNDENSNERFKNWLSSLTLVLLKENVKIEFSSDDLRDTYANALSSSLFYGVKECFVPGDYSKTKELVLNYFKAFYYLLNMEVN